MTARWPCPMCGLRRSGSGVDYYVDPCIGRPLQGVAQACCGHGQEERAYVDLKADDPTGLLVQLRGASAVDYLHGHGVGPFSRDQLRLFIPPRRRVER
jgi:hypothetical protein